MATDQQRQDDLVITASVLTSISLLIVIIRSVVRMIIIRKPGWDDYTIIVAMFFQCGYLAEILVCRANGIGMPLTTLTMDNIQNFIKATLAIQCTYYAAIAFIKISILCMYLRFAVTRTLRVLCIATILFHAAFFVVCLSVTLAQCRPMEKMWDLTGMVAGSCINTTAFFYFTSGFNICTDIWILALPVKTLIGINRPRKEKIALIFIFGVGLFATIVSIVRLHTIYVFTLAMDPVRDGVAVNLWSTIEVNAAIVCASVPALKPLFTPSQLFATTKVGSGSGPSDGSTPKHSGYKYHSSGKSGSNLRSNQPVDQSYSDKSINLGQIGTNSTLVPNGDGRTHSDSDKPKTFLRE